MYGVLILLCSCIYISYAQNLLQQGVLLARLTENQLLTLQNVTIINAASLSNNHLACFSSLKTTSQGIGEWHYPNGSLVGPREQHGPFYALPKSDRAELHLQDRFTSTLEGIYSCKIPDENSVLQTLYVGIYTNATYQGQVSPRLNSPPILREETSLSTILPTFTITCTSSASPPTRVTWTHNGAPLSEGNSENFQVLRDGRTSTFDNILRVKGGEQPGTYACSVGNIRGSTRTEIEILSPPSNIRASVQSPTSILVHWDLFTDQEVSGFKVTYIPAEGSCDGVEGRSELVEGGGTTSHTLRGLEEFTEYKILVRTQGRQGLGLPSTSILRLKTGAVTPGPPVGVVAVGSSSPREFTISWKELECKEVNDDTGILHYIIRYGVAGSPLRHSRQSTSTTFTIRDSNFKQLEKYEFEVGAVNSMGIGSYSSLATAAIPKAPGPVANLRTIPGIVSMLLTWDPPTDQRVHDLITEYELNYHLYVPGANPINQIRVNRTVTSYRVTNLIPQMTYEVSIRARIGTLKGEVTIVIQTTRGIDQVFGVMAVPVNATSMEVSWRKLSVDDVLSYKVNYALVNMNSSREREKEESQGGSVSFPGDACSGVVGGLREGSEYEFQVVAVVNVSGVEQEGNNTSEAIGARLPNAIVTKKSQGVLFLVILAPVLIVILSIVIIIVVILVKFRARTPRRRKEHDFSPTAVNSTYDNIERHGGNQRNGETFDELSINGAYEKLNLRAEEPTYEVISASQENLNNGEVYYSQITVTKTAKESNVQTTDDSGYEVMERRRRDHASTTRMKKCPAYGSMTELNKIEEPAYEVMYSTPRIPTANFVSKKNQENEVMLTILC